MAVSSGFFDSVNHDRLYNADQVSSMFDGLILDGVYENMGEAFAINAYPDAENTVIVGTGRAWFDHTWTLNDTQYALTLDPPSDSMSRIDAIVLDVDKTLEVRNNTIKLIKGTPVFTGEDPQKPTLIKEDLHNQYPLAYVTRSAGASATINQADIEYMVGTDECPMVIGLLEVINIEQVYAQLKDEFYLWWDGVILGDPDMATHLQDQIDELERQIDAINANKITFDTVKSAVPFFSLDPYHSVYDCRPFILPDGYILFLFRGESEDFPSTTAIQNNMPTSAKYNDNGSINCCLYNLDGVYSNYTNIATVNTSYGSNVLNDYTWLYCGTVFTEQTDTYPAYIRIMYLSNVDTDGIEIVSSNKTGTRMKVNGFTYTLAVIKITADHIISVEKSSINVSPTLKNYYLDIGSGYGAGGSGVSVSHIPAISSNGNEYAFSTSGFSSSTNSRATMCTWTSFCVTEDNVFSMVENSDTSSHNLNMGYVIGNGGGSDVMAKVYSVYPHVSNSDNLIILCPDNTFLNYNSGTWVYYAFTLDGHFSDAYKFHNGTCEHPNTTLKINNFLSKISSDKDNLKMTDMSFVSDGYLYRQDANDPSSLVKEPFTYQSVDVNFGSTPSYIVLFSDISEVGETGDEEEPVKSYLDYYESENISSSLEINSIVVTPDKSLLIASYIDSSKPGATENQQGIKIMLLDGGSKGVFSQTYSYSLPVSILNGDYGEYSYDMAFKTFANPIGASYDRQRYSVYGQLGLKRNFWTSGDKKTYLVIVYGYALELPGAIPWIYGVSPNSQMTIWRIDR